LCRQLAEYNESVHKRRRSGKENDAHQQATLITQLNKIDEKIKTGFAKDLVAVLFFSDETDNDSEQNSIAAAEKVYARIRVMAQQVYAIFKNK